MVGGRPAVLLILDQAQMEEKVGIMHVAAEEEAAVIMVHPLLLEIVVVVVQALYPECRDATPLQVTET